MPAKRNIIEKKEKAKLMLHGNLEELFIKGDLGAVEVIRAQKLKSIFDIYKTPKEYKRKLVLWFRGPTGEGKTRTAIQIANEYYKLDYLLSNDSLKWFDGYRGQKVAIIDDFRKSMLTDWNFLLRLLDGYNLIVQVKGGFTQWNPEIIIITSPASPHEAFSWINKEGEEQAWDKEEQLLRRLTYIDEEQIYDFPLWKEDEEKLNLTIKKFLGLPILEEEEADEWRTIQPEA